VAGALSNAAVGDDGFIPRDANLSVEFLKFLLGFESTISVDGATSRHIDGTWNMTRTHGKFLHSLRSKNFSLIFIRRANVNELSVGAFFNDRQDIGQTSSEIRINSAHSVCCGPKTWGSGVQGAALRYPLVAASIQELKRTVAINVKDPSSLSGKPVVGVPIDNDSVIVGNTRT